MKKKEYPIPRVEKPNLEYAKILEQDYAGVTSEETAIHLYLYQHIIEGVKGSKFSSILEEIMINEMHHLELLGTTITLLGGNPNYKVTSTIGNKPYYWNASYVNDTTNILEMLAVDIESEKQAIRNYELHRSMINDNYIKELLTFIIEDEKEHIRMFEEFKKNYILRKE